MSSLRPPGKAVRRFTAFSFAFLFVISSVSESLGAGELYLPDLVVPRRSRKDIPQPYAVLNIDSDWIFHLPRYRRIYPLPFDIESFGIFPDPAPEILASTLPITIKSQDALDVQCCDLPIMVKRGITDFLSLPDHPDEPVRTAVSRKMQPSGWRS